jgi:hypothetical protein
MDDNRIRIAPQKILGKTVEFAAFQDYSDPVEIIGQSQRLLQGCLIKPADQRLGSLVFDQGIGGCDSMARM